VGRFKMSLVVIAGEHEVPMGEIDLGGFPNGTFDNLLLNNFFDLVWVKILTKGAVGVDLAPLKESVVVNDILRVHSLPDERLNVLFFLIKIPMGGLWYRHSLLGELAQLLAVKDPGVILILPV
jgi:hypothetical protein